MSHVREELLDLTNAFLKLQIALLQAWRAANPNSVDLELLLDFPKRSQIKVDSATWMALRHGVGVHFQELDGKTVDVTFAVDQPFAFHPGRLFDFLVTCPQTQYKSLPRLRKEFEEVFHAVVLEGTFVRQGNVSTDQLFRVVSPPL